MKIKEVQAGIKVTKNYDSYQASLAADIETGEDPEKVGAELMEKASAIVNKRIGAELNKKPVSEKRGYSNKDKETEVGAAWLDKKFKDRLSVKDSGTGKWKDVNVADLEKTSEGYRQKTAEGMFVFKKLSERERTSNKMPMYRIYKIGES
jgi:hypothetical protein